MPIFILVIVLFFFITSCGTLTDRNQIISIDSTPRNLDVYVKNENDLKYLGKTPFFYQTQRSFSHTFLFKDQSFEREHKWQCGINWPSSFIPNAIVGGIEPVYGLGFFVIDGLTQNLFDCDEQLLISFDSKKPAVAPCHHILVLPPTHSDEFLSDLIVEQWKRALEVRNAHCDKIIFSDELKNDLLMLNIDHSRQVEFPNINMKALKKIAYKFNATHIAYLTLEERGIGYGIVPAIYDLHTLDVIDSNNYQVMIPKHIGQKLIGRPNFFTKSIRLFPNSNYKIISDKQYYEVPRVLSMISIETIDHPNGYRIWDASTQIYPSIKTIYDKHKLSLVDAASSENQTSEQVDYTYTKILIVPLLYIAGIAHTPVGAFGLGLGGGLSYFYFKDNIETKKSTLAHTIALDFFYYAFITQNLYVTVNAQTYYLDRNQVKTEHYISPELIVSSGVGIGYFFPYLKRHIRRIF